MSKFLHLPGLLPTCSISPPKGRICGFFYGFFDCGLLWCNWSLYGFMYSVVILITWKYVMYLFCLFCGALMYGSICNYVLLGDWDCRFCVRMYSITQINLFNLCRVTSPKFKCIHACINDWLGYSNKWLVILNVGLVISESKCLNELEYCTKVCASMFAALSGSNHYLLITSRVLGPIMTW